MIKKARNKRILKDEWMNAWMGKLKQHDDRDRKCDMYVVRIFQKCTTDLADQKTKHQREIVRWGVMRWGNNNMYIKERREAEVEGLVSVGLVQVTMSKATHPEQIKEGVARGRERGASICVIKVVREGPLSKVE